MSPSEDIIQTKEFQMIKRGLMKEFPEILDVLPPTDESIQKYKHHLYITIKVNPYLLSKTFGWCINSFVVYLLKNGPQNYSVLSVLFGNDNYRESINRQEEYDSYIDNLRSFLEEALPPNQLVKNQEGISQIDPKIKMGYLIVPPPPELEIPKDLNLCP